MKRITSIIVLSSVLTGCGVVGGSNTEDDFLCEAQAGSPCTTIAAADGMNLVNGASVAEKPSDTAVKSLSQRPLFGGKNSVTSPPDGGFPYNAASYRQPEVVGTLWIAPIRDGEGIFQEARFVHFVISEGAWVN